MRRKRRALLLRIECQMPDSTFSPLAKQLTELPAKHLVIADNRLSDF